MSEPALFVVAISACPDCSRPIRLVTVRPSRDLADARAAEISAELAAGDVPAKCARAVVLDVSAPTAGLMAWVRGRHG